MASCWTTPQNYARLISAMLSVVITVVCFVCYCCHRTIKKRSTTMTSYRHRWMETDPNMEIYSVEQVQCTTQAAAKLFAVYSRRNPRHTLMTIFEGMLLLVAGGIYLRVSLHSWWIGCGGGGHHDHHIIKAHRSFAFQRFYFV